MTDVIDQGAASFVAGQHDGIHRVVVRGELDLACRAPIEAFIESIFAEEPAAMIVDLSGLSFMDSTGLRLLLLIKEQAEGIGCALAVIPGPPQVQRLFDLTGLSMALPWIHRDFVGAS